MSARFCRAGVVILNVFVETCAVGQHLRVDFVVREAGEAPSP